MATFADVPLDRTPQFSNLAFTFLSNILDIAGSRHRSDPADINRFRIDPSGTYGEYA